MAPATWPAPAAITPSVNTSGTLPAPWASAWPMWHGDWVRPRERGAERHPENGTVGVGGAARAPGPLVRAVPAGLDSDMGRLRPHRPAAPAAVVIVAQDHPCLALGRRAGLVLFLPRRHRNLERRSGP